MGKKDGDHASEEKGNGPGNIIYKMWEAGLRLRVEAVNSTKKRGDDYTKELEEYNSFTNSLIRVLGDEKAKKLIKKYPVNHGAGTD